MKHHLLKVLSAWRDNLKITLYPKLRDSLTVLLIGEQSIPTVTASHIEPALHDSSAAYNTDLSWNLLYMNVNNNLHESFKSACIEQLVGRIDTLVVLLVGIILEKALCVYACAVSLMT
jgi:hypothetical protein